ncbi:MAG: mechanosensitive ion channel family protein [Pseudomonadota bacterium]
MQQFWEFVDRTWGQQVLGLSVSRIVIAVLIIIVFLLARRLLARLILWRLRVWRGKSGRRRIDGLVDAIKRPIGLVPVIVGLFLAVEVLELDASLQIPADNVILTLVIIAIFWTCFCLVEPLRFLFKPLQTMFSNEMVEWLARSIKGAFIFIAAVSILELWGIQVAPILAGLGIFGVAVALGAQDLFKNLIAGLLIIAEKRFGNGDWIKVDGVVEGTVENIGFRSTLVRRFDKAPVQVPNYLLSDQAVTNFSAMTFRRIYWTIGVEYRTTVDQLRQIRDELETYVTANEDFVRPEEAATFVRIDSFSDSSINIMLYCFTRTTNWGEWLEIKETLSYRIKEIIEGAGTGFAFPSRSIYVETLPAQAPEIFEPPGTKLEGSGEAS